MFACAGTESYDIKRSMLECPIQRVVSFYSKVVNRIIVLKFALELLQQSVTPQNLSRKEFFGVVIP